MRPSAIPLRVKGIVHCVNIGWNHQRLPRSLINFWNFNAPSSLLLPPSYPLLPPLYGYGILFQSYMKLFLPIPSISCFLRTNPSRRAPARCNHRPIKPSLFRLEIIQQDRTLLALLSPVSHNNTRAVNHLPRVPLAVQYAYAFKGA